MKKIFSLLVINFCFGLTYVKADQLAYLSKADADKGASLIESCKKIALFCGCCDNQTMEIIKPKGVEVRFTNFEQYYEIYVMYSYKGEVKSIPVDLAYVWIKLNGELQTVGTALGLEHDYCKKPSW